ncbi:extracellular solute-binding protein [Verrucomicrobiaceae bacterium R5-34]|uniref:Extracellular solute-binding protein n=1 Tax=Oceaniferula flava TaxID=2800421 RepID=A0AAE2SEL1_9BACT|nr:extracellular solute-binding protein [Oceaniferula flavus]MBK1831040.1 extracellular solute-binding protein [Verrucomicrobiaceae bacterium R5-34]MBK1855557.1 extracellular solute-binding protein [Oceaniferula flavus]MBM1136863.1 extracellular solute-binding protein [Oceaniferula flavus]
MKLHQHLAPWVNSKSLVALALVICVATPLLMSRKAGTGKITAENADRRITIITPHNETIRREFGEAFQAWWQEEHGETVYVNWLTPGGTSEIRKILDGRFAAAKKTGDTGVEIDIFFGGGDYEFRIQAEKDRFAKLDVFESHPEWFGEDALPQTFSGEIYYAEDHSWVGVCLSRFGICYNVDALRRRGLEPPETWEDLGDPKYFGGIALSDPNKSGSVARAFEMLIQQQMHEAAATAKVAPGETPDRFQARVLNDGWDRGINLIQKIGANARYFTDSSTKIPHDVASGDAAAGMCVDFYGRTYEQMLMKEDGSSRLHWISPKGGTSMSVDPVAVLKGAPDPELAQAFVEFLVSEQGQVLWNARPGSPIGPRHHALRRMPVRRDVYTAENLQHFTDQENPYEMTGGFVYDRALTGKGFKALQFVIRVLCLDAHEELKEAWVKLTDAGMPERATKIFSDTTLVSYQNTMGDLRRQLSDGTKVETARMAVRLGKLFRKNYELAGELAEEGK